MAVMADVDFRPGPRREPRAMDDLPDEQLMQSVGQGNHQAYAVLVTRHMARAVHFAERMTYRRMEAEELVQEAFLRVWVHAPGWKPDGALFRTWFMRILTNLCIDLKRRPTMAPLGDADELQDQTPNAEMETERRKDAAVVAAALAELPPRQRAALALCYWQETSALEAADILKVSIGAIESLLVRGRRTLREKLAPKFGFDGKGMP